ncbi:hypothetical protein T06_7611 [Trichinella sp. T6]|nr:hypothetical protein T06_7611 [Trichinella sp. T6]
MKLAGTLQISEFVHRYGNFHKNNSPSRITVNKNLESTAIGIVYCYAFLFEMKYGRKMVARIPGMSVKNVRVLEQQPMNFFAKKQSEFVGVWGFSSSFGELENNTMRSG